MSRLHDHRRGGAVWRRFAAVVLTLGSLSLAAETPAQPAEAAAQSADTAGQALLLDVQINGHSIGKIGEFTLREGILLARRAELHELGFRGPFGLVSRDTARSASDELIPLSEVPQLKWSIDQATQTLFITVQDSQLLPTVLEVSTHSRPAGRFETQTGTGFTMNYDFAGTSSAGENGASGSLDMRAFSPAGIVSSGLLLYAGTPQGATGTSHAIRLDSTYSFADTNSMRRYSVGDLITGGLSWTRPIRLAGGQVRSDFSMRPDLITFPMPSIAGSVAVASTVSILTDGHLLMSQDVNPGPFQTPQLPVVSGAGTISMRVTNAMGQQMTVNQPFYVSSSLLVPGLKTFSVQAGAVRRNWGAESNDYGSLAATAIYRRGLTRKATVEGSMEAAPGTIMAGGGGVLQVGNLGVVDIAFAGSSGSPGQGGLLSIGGQRLSRVFSLSASVAVTNRNFRDVAATNGDPYPRKQFNVSSGLTLHRFGSVGIAYVSLRADAPTTLAQQYAGSGRADKILSASYSIQVHRGAIYVNEFRDFGVNASNGMQIGLSISLGKRKSGGASLASDGSTQIRMQQSATQVGEWGYQTYNSTGQSTHQFVQAQYKSPWSLMSAGMDRDAGVNSFRVETQGSVSLVDRGIFPSNTIYDSFAIVDTNRMAHVGVLQENRLVGSTNSSGRLLVPDLRSFDLNHLAVSPGDIPPDVSIDTTTRDVRPQDRTGIVVRFRAKVSHGALLKLIDEAGLPVPVGSTATLQASGITVPVGFDGEAYIEDLGPHNEVSVGFANGHHCTVLFPYQGLPGDIPVIGPLACLESRP